MTDGNGKNVVPFALSPERMRRGAIRREKAGDPVAAVELLRRAAEEDDRMDGWLLLARRLRTLQCPETGATLCRQLLQGDEECAAAWLTLAQCQMDAEEGAKSIEDSLFRALHFDGEGKLDGSIRACLAAQEEPPMAHRASRAGHLAERSALAWAHRDYALAWRRTRRAAKMADNAATPWLTLAVACLHSGNGKAAWNACLKALKADENRTDAKLLLGTAAWCMGRRRLALGIVERAAKYPCTLREERLFFTAADGVRELQACYLRKQLKLMPCRIPLLERQAMQLLRREKETALPVLTRIVRLDPENVWARMALIHPEFFEGAAMPKQAQALLMDLLAKLLASPPPQGLPSVDSLERCALVWGIQHADDDLLALLSAHFGASDNEKVRMWMKRHLPQPDEAADEDRARREICLHMTMLTGARYCSPGVLLAYADRAWKRIPSEVCCHAVGQASIRWPSAVTLCCLRHKGMEQAEAQLCRHLGAARAATERAARRVEKWMAEK